MNRSDLWAVVSVACSLLFIFFFLGFAYAYDMAEHRLMDPIIPLLFGMAAGTFVVAAAVACIMGFHEAREDRRRPYRRSFGR